MQAFLALCDPTDSGHPNIVRQSALTLVSRTSTSFPLLVRNQRDNGLRTRNGETGHALTPRGCRKILTAGSNGASRLRSPRRGSLVAVRPHEAGALEVIAVAAAVQCVHLRRQRRRRRGIDEGGFRADSEAVVAGKVMGWDGRRGDGGRANDGGGEGRDGGDDSGVAHGDDVERLNTHWLAPSRWKRRGYY